MRIPVLKDKHGPFKIVLEGMKIGDEDLETRVDVDHLMMGLRVRGVGKRIKDRIQPLSEILVAYIGLGSNPPDWVRPKKKRASVYAVCAGRQVYEFGMDGKVITSYKAKGQTPVLQLPYIGGGSGGGGLGKSG